MANSPFLRPVETMGAMSRITNRRRFGSGGVAETANAPVYSAAIFRARPPAWRFTAGTAARIVSVTLILRSRALARRLEGWPRALAHPSRRGENAAPQDEVGV